MSTAQPLNARLRTSDLGRAARGSQADGSNAFWLLALLLLTFIPRLISAMALEGICQDGYIYLEIADAYRRGDYDAGLRLLNVNVYPVLVSRLPGFDKAPLLTAQAWSVAAATLAVFPLFGWLRRQFDRNVAVAGCAVYAVHPEFVTLSAEPIRDATFWLLTTSSLYLSWRAASERRLILFLAAGLTWAAAIHTRTEGWLLALPAVGWPVTKWAAARGERWRLAAGLACHFAMLPCFLVAFNLTALAGHDRWEWGRGRHVHAALDFVSSPGAAGSPSPLILDVPSPDPGRGLADDPRKLRDAPSGSTKMTAVRRHTLASDADIKDGREGTVSEPEGRGRIGSYLKDFVDALKPVLILLTLGGVASQHRLFLRKECLILAALIAAVMAAVWIRMVELGDINGRYFLMCFFPAAGAAGVGLVCLLSKVRQIALASPLRPFALSVTACFAAIMAGGHLADALTESHPSRVEEARLGRVLRSKFGSNCRIAAVPQARRVAHYATGRLPGPSLRGAHVLVLKPGEPMAAADARAQRKLREKLLKKGWQIWEDAAKPEDIEVLVNPSKASGTAVRSSSTRL